MDKFSLQNSQYAFPYHYIPHFSPRGNPSRIRFLAWGLEYLCYQHHLKQLVEALKPGSVLEVGCGDGFFIGLLDKSIARRKGIDLSREAIAFARAFHPDVCFDSIPVDGCEDLHDVVVAVEVLEHIPDEGVDGFLRNIAERVRPGGTLILSVPTTVLPLNKKHFRHYTRPLLERQLKGSGAGVVLDRVEYVYRESRLWTLYSRLASNRFWTLELHAINRLMWNRIWSRNRFASEKDGNHLVAILRKPVKEA